MNRRAFAVVLVSGLLAACSQGAEPEPSMSGSSPEARAPVQVLVANYEIVADQTNRVMVGLITEDGRTVAYGSVQMRFAQDTGGSARGE